LETQMPQSIRYQQLLQLISKDLLHDPANRP
jgi:hypothetical protein